MVVPDGEKLGKSRRQPRILSILEMKKSANLLARAVLSSISGSLLVLFLPIRPMVIENSFLELPLAALMES